MYYRVLLTRNYANAILRHVSRRTHLRPEPLRFTPPPNLARQSLIAPFPHLFALAPLAQRRDPSFSIRYTLLSIRVSRYPQHPLYVAHSLAKTPGGGVLLFLVKTPGNCLTPITSISSAKTFSNPLRIYIFRKHPGDGSAFVFSINYLETIAYGWPLQRTMSVSVGGFCGPVNPGWARLVLALLGRFFTARGERQIGRASCRE